MRCFLLLFWWADGDQIIVCKHHKQIHFVSILNRYRKSYRHAATLMLLILAMRLYGQKVARSVEIFYKILLMRGYVRC